MRNLQELTDFVEDEREEAHLDGDGAVDFFLSEQFLLLSLSQGFAILPMPEGDVYPSLSVLPLDDDFTEHAVLAYRQDGMTEELKKFLSLFAGMP